MENAEGSGNGEKKGQITGKRFGRDPGKRVCDRVVNGVDANVPKKAP